MTATMFRLWAAGIASAALLVGCGGGGSASPSDTTAAPTTGGTTPATATFAVAAGYQALIDNGTNESFSLSGSCSGAATIVTAPAVAATFEGVAGYSASQVSTVSFSNCLPATNTASGVTYYNASRVPIGLSISGGEYSTFESPPADLPASVRVGDTATVATLTTYADSSKTTLTGKRVISYLIESDTDTTAIANLITRSYNTSGQLLATQQSRYRMAANGTLTLLSIDVQFSTTSTVHLLYTVK